MIYRDRVHINPHDQDKINMANNKYENLFLTKGYSVRFLTEHCIMWSYKKSVATGLNNILYKKALFCSFDALYYLRSSG